MGRLARICATACVALSACAGACALPARALASGTQVSMLMDDDQLIYVDHQHMVQTLQTIHSLGVDVVKVSLVWQLVAPDPYSSRKPSFDDTDPAAYPPGAWTRYDNLVRTAQALGMKVYFLIIGPAPDWAVPRHLAHGQGPSLGYPPILGDFRDFVEAAGRRYSGAYVDPSAQPPPAATSIAGVTVPDLTGAQQQSQPAPPPQPIPRVDYWGIWNEPNERSWLNPWYRPLPHHRRAYIQPELYRGLVDAAWQGLASSDHASDTVMIGETANRGILTPVQFVRSLYCVSARLRPLRGAAASAVGCPASGPPGSFVAAHPGLFEAAGYAHHPYAFDSPPNRPYPDRSFVTIYNLRSFERLLNRIFAVYGVHPSGGVPIYLTEWGYKTDPPNPYAHVSLATQAAWLDEGEYMTWRDPFVRSLTQFLLVDSLPKPGARRGSALYWSTFQTGLETMSGAPKPAFSTYRMPIWLPVARHGSHVAVWGQVRPADHAASQWAILEFRPRGSSKWSELTELQTNSPEGYFWTHVSIPSAGAVRLAWYDPSLGVIFSRTVGVR